MTRWRRRRRRCYLLRVLARPLWAAMLVSALVSVPAIASAQTDDPPRVELHLEDCLGADASAVRRILAAELGAVSIATDPDAAGGSEPDEDTTVTHAACGVESAIVVVSHARGDIRVERRVNLAGAAPNARTRLLALSIAEQVAAVWSAVHALPPEPEPAPVESEPEPEEPDRPRALPLRHLVRAPEPEPEGPPTRPLGLRAIGVVRVSGSPVHISYGGGLGIEIGLPYSLGVGADFRYEQGETDAGALGRVALRTAWGTVLALVRPMVGWSSLTIGAGAKLGVAWLEGLPLGGATGATHAGFVAGPAAVAQVALHIGGSGYVHLGLELSWITVGVSGLNGATRERVASFGGPQLAITAGFEIQPSR